MWYKTSNRKPYYDLKKSLTDFFQEHVRFIHESNTIESQFEKPYQMLDEYHKMHLRDSWPNWVGGGGGVIPSLNKGCAFISNPNPEDETVFSIGSIGNSSLPSNTVGPFNIVIGSGEGTWYKTCKFCLEPDCPNYAFSVDTDKHSFTIHLDDSSARVKVSGAGSCQGTGGCSGRLPSDCPDDYYDFDINMQSYFCVEKAGVGSKCKRHEKYPCDPCLNPTELSWVIGPEVMTRAAAGVDENLTLELAGGVAPYVWDATVTAGSGSFAYGDTTELPVNLLNISDDSCGSVTITVTDYCSQELTLEIRITNVGKWCKTDECTIASTNCNTISSACCCPTGGSNRYTKIYATVGKYWSMNCYCGLSGNWCNNYPAYCSCTAACTGDYATDCPAYLPPGESSYPYGMCHCYTSCRWEWKCSADC